jgi:hypothetical protein
MPQSNAVEGEQNPNGQILVARFNPRTGHSGLSLRCIHCGFRYDSNGSEFDARKCPQCQGGPAGVH